MLSRVAERVYWMGRYMERCESTARLINVNTKLLLDLPRGVNIGWGTLILISGGEDYFQRDVDAADERAVMRFMLADTNNPCSLINTIAKARENARITREILPSEVWELINDLYWYIDENVGKTSARRERHILLQKVIDTVQQFTGMLAGCMSQNDAYSFISIGRNLERADMTSRIVDVGASSILPLSEVNAEPFENILWMSVLRSLSAYQMYRQHVLDRVNAEDVVMFLFQDPLFPRAIEHCLAHLAHALESLPNNEESLRVLASVRRKVKSADFSKLIENGLHDYIDELQDEVAVIHRAIASAWFLPDIQVAS